jgi:hypothetical protein
MRVKLVVDVGEVGNTRVYRSLAGKLEGKR